MNQRRYVLTLFAMICSSSMVTLLYIAFGLLLRSDPAAMCNWNQMLMSLHVQHHIVLTPLSPNTT